MPEGDQTKWRGIKPTDPPEDIPVSLDGEVVHVIVDSGGGGGLMPGAPLMVDLYVAGSAVNIWYTLLNVAGAGHVEKIHFGSVLNFENSRCRVTVDGGVPVIYQATIFTKTCWQSLAHNLENYKELPVFLIRYETSIKVEIGQTHSTPRALYGLATYLPDPP